MDLAEFIEQKRPYWRQLEELLRQVEGSGLRTLREEQAIAFGRLYRSAASDLNQAQTFMSGETTVQYLNDLVARCYLIIYARSQADFWGMVGFVVKGYPALFRRCWKQLLLATGLLLLGSIFGFLVSWYDKETARSFLLPVEMPMIQPSREGEEDQALAPAGELAGMSSFYFTHNLSVSLVAFALGITLGIGTAWMMFYNGVLLGALGAVFAEAGQFKAFCAEVLPHGVLEIPAIIIAGAGGFLLAQAILRAKPWPRLEELARTGRQAIFLVCGCVPLLAYAGVLEAVVARAPYGYLGPGFKLSVAGIFALAFAAYLLLPGWGRELAK